jgi:hypothetical protein
VKRVFLNFRALARRRAWFRFAAKGKLMTIRKKTLKVFLVFLFFTMKGLHEELENLPEI